MEKKFAIIGLAVIFILAAGPGIVLAATKIKTAATKKLGSASASRANTVLRKPATPSPAKPVSSNNIFYDPQTSAYIQASTYYLMPNQTFTVAGSYFAPNEQVEILAAGVSKIVTSDNRGNFTTDPFKLSLADIRSTVEVTAVGKSSHVTRSANLVVGTYYPTVVPDSYYKVLGSQVVFSGKSYAPGEQVSVYYSGKVLDTVTADSGGNFNYSVKVRDTAGSQEYNFIGRYTQTMFRVNLTVGLK
jgi:hypothetical protein